MTVEWSEIAAPRAARLLAGAVRLPLEQSWPYTQAMSAETGAAIRYLALGERAVAAVVARRWWGLWPVRECLRGPVWLDPPPDEAVRATATLDVLRAAFGRSVFGLSFWTPDAADAGRAAHVARMAGMRRVFTGHATSCVPVLADERRQRARLDGKWRNALVAGESRARLRVRTTREPRAVLEILDRYDALRRARRFAGPHGALLRGAAALSGRDRHFAVIAERGAGAEAGALVLCHGNEATWVAGFAAPFARAEAGHRRVLLAALAELRRMGIATLDLGGLDTRAAPGIARFKLGLGGTVTVLPGTWGR